MNEIEFAGPGSSGEVAAGAAVRIKQPPRHQQSSILSDPGNWEIGNCQPLRITKRKIKNGAVLFLTVFGTCLSSSTAKGNRRHWKSYSKWRTMLQLEKFPEILNSFAKRQRSAFKRYKRNHGVVSTTSIQAFYGFLIAHKINLVRI
jgi:hypothetical protein